MTPYPVVTKHLIDITLRSMDLIKLLLDGETPDESVLREAAAAFKTLVSLPPLTPAGVSPSLPQENLSGDNGTHRIRFIPAAEIFLAGTNPLPLIADCRHCNQTYGRGTDAVVQR
jgi:hypothetical protein